MGDLISRTQAVDALRKMQTYKLFAGDDMILVDKAQVQTELMMLPSAQSERKTGKWITHLYKLGKDRYECDSCHKRCDTEYCYCPNCGADMRREIR